MFYSVKHSLYVHFFVVTCPSVRVESLFSSAQTACRYCVKSKYSYL